MPIRNGRAVKARVVGVGDPVVDGRARPGVTPAGREIGSGARQAAPGTVAANDFLVKTASTTLSAERVVTDTATVTWDWSTPGQAKATASGSGITQLTGDVTAGPGSGSQAATVVQIGGVAVGGDPLPQYALDAALGGAAALNVGTAPGTVAAGDDARIVGAVQASVLTTEEDILIRRGGVPARLPKGSLGGMVPMMVGGVIVWTALSFTLALAGTPCMTPIAQQGSPARTT